MDKDIEALFSDVGTGVAKRRILSLDGGGLKGVIAAAYLARVEEVTGKRTCDHFDLIAGTSTGGLLALGLALGYPAADILKLYVERGPIIFSQAGRYGATAINRGWLNAKSVFSSKYDAFQLKKQLTEFFKDARLGECLTRVVIPAYCPNPSGPHLFKTAHHPRIENDYKELVVDVALATSAAPYYLPKHVMANGERLIDGGIWANNPIGVAALEAVCILEWEPQDISIFSLGYESPVDVPLKGGLWHFGRGKALNVLMEGQALVSTSTAKLLLKRPSAEGRLFRDVAKLDDKIFKMDSAHRLKEMVGIGREMARAALPRLRRDFFNNPCEQFIPFHKERQDDQGKLQDYAA